MSQCQCEGIENIFDQRRAAQLLEKTRRRGPQKTTRVLLEALKSRGVEGKSLLDIGGGIGVIQHELLECGLAEVTGVEASSAYLETTRAETERRGHAARARYFLSDFVALAPAIPAADIVTLDRVICCYNDMKGLVSASSKKAGDTYGLVYPRGTLWAKLSILALNAVLWLRGSPFRVFVHPPETVDSIVRTNGLSPFFSRTAGMWQVVVYAREKGGAQ